MGKGLWSWIKNSNLKKYPQTVPYIDVAEEDTPSRKTIKPKITDHVDYDSNHSEIVIESSIDDDAGLINKPATNKTVPNPHKSTKQKNIISSEEYQKPKVEDYLTSTAKITYRDRGDIEAHINSTSNILIEKLAQFGIEAEVVNVNVGPIITQYELKPAPNIKVSRFQSLADDLALAIKARSIRVQAPIPGRGLIGIEVPNKHRDTIYLKDVLLSDQMEKSNGKLTIALGKDIVGTPVVADLSRMPHLLIAGSTNSGKSVCINSIICNLLFNNTPDELRLVLIDPKRVELSGYEDIPHLIQEIVSGSEQALTVLNWAVSEMERRYELLQECNVRDISSYNKKNQITGKGKQ
jgi:S-DNA-T family DNA segregation ATPase FtsK/SpoIIIE